MSQAAVVAVADRDASDADRERLHTYRSYAVIAGVLVPFFWVVYRMTDPAAYDPLPLRLALTGISFGLLILSFTSAYVRKRFIPFMHGLLYVLTTWFVWLSAANGFSPNYAVGLLFVISAISVAMSTGLRRIAPLRWYISFTVALTTAAVAASPSAIGPIIFVGCVASIGVVIHVAASATIRAQAQLARSERKYRRLFSSANDAILVVDPTDLTIAEANEKAADLYGFSHDELVGIRVDQMADEPWFDEVPAENIEAVHRRKNGAPIHVLISTAQIDYGGRTAYLSINRDVTERVNTMASLSVANEALMRRTRDLQDFTTAASHDLQEPVRKMRTFADLIRHEYGPRLDGTGREYLDRLQEIGVQMSRIIADLVVYAQIPSEEEAFQETALTVVARDAADHLADSISAAEAVVDIGELPTAEVVPSQLRDLLRHLIANALEARRADAPLTVELRGASSEHTCRVQVVDNGIGIETRHFDKIFSPFRHLKSVRPQGRTGMGLAICKRIVEHHGGTITVESTVGKGSTFTVELPRRQSRETHSVAFPRSTA